MDISSLIQLLPKRQKPSNAGRVEVDFPVVSEAGRFSYMPNIFRASEIVRMNAGSTYIWGGKVDFNDFSLGVLRTISADVTIEGALPTSEADLKALLAVVLKEKFDYKRVFERALDHALLRCGQPIGGKFVEKFRNAADREDIFKAIADVLNEEKLYATKVQLTPVCLDGANSMRDLTDDMPGLTFRTRDMLEQNAIGYKARLIWGQDIASRVGRLAYRGQIEGKEAKGAPATVLVEHQIQPMEAWFRRLLADALGEQMLEDIISNNPSMVENVRQRVSAQLSTGTGRQVESLVLHLLPSSATLRPERSMQFREYYEVAGIKGTGLEVLHEVKYKLEDRDRWRAAGAPDPQVFLHKEVAEATKLFLHGKRFEDIVSYYLEQRGAGQLGQRSVTSDLTDAINNTVTPIARAHGHRILSSSAILTIPQQAFIDGLPIRLDVEHYALAEPLLKPPIQITVEVQIADEGGVQNNFASALARQEPLEPRVTEAIRQYAHIALRECSALDYFGSTYVNGLPQLAPQAGAAVTFDKRIDHAGPLLEDLGPSFKFEFESGLNQMLADRFGLKAKNVSLTPGRDEFITRMSELAQRTIQYPEGIDSKKGFGLTRGEQKLLLQLEANGEIFVYGPSKGHWASFQHNVKRFPTVEDHADAIRNVLHRALQTLQNELINEAVRRSQNGAAMGGAGMSLLPRPLCERVVEDFTRATREQYGLDVRLHPLNLMAVWPKENQSTQAIVESLHRTIEKISRQREQTDEEHEWDRLSVLLQRARKELNTEAALLEKEISQVETVVVLQDMRTGLLLPAPAAQPTDDPSSP